MVESYSYYASLPGALKIFALLLEITAGVMCIHLISKVPYLKMDPEERDFAFDCASREEDEDKPNCPIFWFVPLSLAVIWFSILCSLGIFMFIMCFKQSDSSLRRIKKIDILFHITAAGFLILAGGLLLTYGIQGEQFDCGPAAVAYRNIEKLGNKPYFGSLFGKSVEGEVTLERLVETCVLVNSKEFWFSYKESIMAAAILIVTAVLSMACGCLRIRQTKQMEYIRH